MQKQVIPKKMSKKARAHQLIVISVVLLCLGVYVFTRPRIYCKPTPQNTGLELRTRNITITAIEYAHENDVLDPPASLGQEEFAIYFGNTSDSGIQTVNIRYVDIWGNEGLSIFSVNVSVYEDEGGLVIASLDYDRFKSSADIMKFDTLTFIVPAGH